MSAAELLVDLAVLGVRLERRGERLRYDAPSGVMTPALLHLLKRHKPELLQLLAPAPESVDAVRIETRADREYRRFLSVCKAGTDGSLRDPQFTVILEGAVETTQEKIPQRWRPVRDQNGRTAVERAERWRSEWAVNGYPPGVTTVTTDSADN